MDLFPIRKLKELPPKTALRKTALIIQKLEVALALQRPSTAVSEQIKNYLKELIVFLEQSDYKTFFTSDLKKGLFQALNCQVLLFVLQRLRISLLGFLGATAAEWDLIDLSEGKYKALPRRSFPINLFLEDLRSPFNVGSIFRSAEAFGVARVILSPYTASPEHRRAAKTSRGTTQVVSWSVGSLAELADTGPIFALETGGKDIREFMFPPEGTALIGSEELGLSPEALALAEKSWGLVSIPLYGAKRSLNVAVACGILLERWTSSLALL